jgi:hypothetical protein
VENDFSYIYIYIYIYQYDKQEVQEHAAAFISRFVNRFFIKRFHRAHGVYRDKHKGYSDSISVYVRQLMYERGAASSCVI